MRVRENPAVASRVLELAFEQSGLKVREPGLHVSELIYCLRKSWLRRHWPYQVAMPTEGDDSKSVMLLGEGHHGVLEPKGQGEYRCAVVAGNLLIHATLDIYLPENPLFKHPTEIKTTRTSANKLPAQDMPYYIEQLASYCLATGDLQGLLLVWHIMGDYREHRTPWLRAWDVTFTEGELKRWQVELGRRGAAVLNPVGPPTRDDHYKWECEYCLFHVDKGGPCNGSGHREAPFFMEAGLPEFLGGEP